MADITKRERRDDFAFIIGKIMRRNHGESNHLL